jgi:GNAT superfamily N-acetyltransferase
LKRDDKILGYQWISFDVCGINIGSVKELKIFPLKEGQAFLYDIFIFREFRRKGVASFLADNTFAALKKKEINELLVIIGVGNIPSLALHLKNGFEPLRVVYHYGFNKIKKIFLGTKKSKRLDQWKEYFKKTMGIS